MCGFVVLCQMSVHNKERNLEYCQSPVFVFCFLASHLLILAFNRALHSYPSQPLLQWFCQICCCFCEWSPGLHVSLPLCKWEGGQRPQHWPNWKHSEQTWYRAIKICWVYLIGVSSPKAQKCKEVKSGLTPFKTGRSHLATWIPEQYGIQNKTGQWVGAVHKISCKSSWRTTKINVTTWHYYSVNYLGIKTQE